MSRTAALSPVIEVSGPIGRQDESALPSRGRKPWAVMAWALVGCALLGTSGVVRAIQDRRFEIEKGYLEACPFPLKDLPVELGGWKMVEGGDKSLDPLTTRISGATDYVMRAYVDELTGVSLSVLVLFGPAEQVVPHTPQICYPACGYSPTDEPSYRDIKGPDGQKYLFRSGVFAKSGGRSVLREVSYHSFRLDGPWSPDAAAGRRFPRKNPGIFKVQIQRRVADGERRDLEDPIEQFIARLLPEIDRRVDAIAGGKTPKATASDESKAATPVGPAR